MKERPILFSAPMVRAILDGSKTQTRRVVKQDLQRLGDGDFYAFDHKGINYRVNARHTTVAAWAHLLQFCPYGQPGDQLWVRETCRADELPSGLDGVRYAADDGFREIEDTPEAADLWIDLNAYRGKQGATVPPIHMPRWASRINLVITGIRVERLNDISEHDAIAEGIPRQGDGFGRWHPDPDDISYTGTTKKPVLSYMGLWESINGPGSWAANPWVWVVEFNRVQS